jgi:hypothetical protein
VHCMLIASLIRWAATRLIRALHADCIPHQVGGYQLDPCFAC